MGHPMKRAVLVAVVTAAIAIAGCGRRERPLGPRPSPSDGGRPTSDASTSQSGRLPVIGGQMSCTPGREVTVACGCSGLGSCSGDPVLMVCSSDHSPGECATSPDTLGVADDTCGLCPSLVVECPSDGLLVVAARGYGSMEYACIAEGAQ
jgi:hypothetical protein